jgi:LysM repeat protein
MALKRGEFRLQSFDPDYVFTGEFGDAAALPDPDSYNGWSVTPIPKRMGITEWAGRNPMVIPVEFLIDRLSEGDTIYVRDMMDTLEKIVATHSRDDEPPVCIFDSGGLVPHDFTHARHVRWVVSGLTWDKDLAVMSESSKRPLRVGGTFTLLQYNHDTTIDAYDGPADRNRKKHDKKKAANKNKGKGKGKGTYTVKAGDSLTEIAAHELGDSKRWKEIADLNNIRNPRKDLKQGMTLKMPVK